MPDMGHSGGPWALGLFHTLKGCFAVVNGLLIRGRSTAMPSGRSTGSWGTWCPSLPRMGYGAKATLKRRQVWVWSSGVTPIVVIFKPHEAVAPTKGAWAAGMSSSIPWLVA